MHLVGIFNLEANMVEHRAIDIHPIEVVDLPGYEFEDHASIGEAVYLLIFPPVHRCHLEDIPVKV